VSGIAPLREKTEFANVMVVLPKEHMQRHLFLQDDQGRGIQNRLVYLTGELIFEDAA